MTGASARALRRLLAVSLLGHAILALAGVRHLFFWGGSLGPWLNGLEALALLAFVALAGGAYLLAVDTAERCETRGLLRAGALLALVAALAPPFLSNDLWDYLARGRVETLGHNPYLVTVTSLRDDPAMAAFAARANWPDWVMPYGPVAALLQRLCALPDLPWVGAYLWKLLAAAAHLATAALLHSALLALGREAAGKRALVLWLWNPWILLECCGSGHNDAFVALGLAASCRWLVRGQAAGASGGYGAAMLVKHGSPALLPLLLFAAARQRRFAAFCFGSVAVAAAAAWAFLHYWQGPDGLRWIQDQGNVARGSLSSLLSLHLAQGLGPATRWLGAALGVATVALGAARVVDARSYARFGCVAMAAFVLLCVPNFAPWYHLWWLPLAPLARHPAADSTLRALALLGPLSYLPFVATHAFGPLHEITAFVLAAALPCWLLFRRAADLLRDGEAHAAD